MSTTEQSTDRVVVGILAGVEPRNGGWFRYSVQEQGQQWPVKCDTKKPDVITAANALLGQVVKVSIGEQQSTNINPHNGQFYINRYLNHIALAGQGDVSSAQPQQQTQPQSNAGGAQQAAVNNSYVDASTKELHIMREHAAERAIQMAAHGLIPQTDLTPEGLVAAAEVWVAYYVYGAARFGIEAFDAGVANEGAQQQHLDNQDQQQTMQPCLKCGFLDGFHAPGCPDNRTDDDIPF